jgi:dolichol-phosphate mannosyltransferase
VVLVEKIKKHLPQTTIIIVDDSRTDIFKKTKNALKNKGVLLIHRNKKSGRGSAVIEGFKKGFKKTKLLYFFEMDADLSHDPADFSKFKKKLKAQRVNLIVGSRYAQASKIKNWPLYRLTLSRIINFSLNFLLNLGLTDYTNGFRLYDREAVKFLISAKLNEKGFIMLSETAYKLKNNGFTISEVPITFTDRTHGKSSVDAKELLSSLLGALRIRFS